MGNDTLFELTLPDIFPVHGFMGFKGLFVVVRGGVELVGMEAGFWVSGICGSGSTDSP